MESRRIKFITIAFFIAVFALLSIPVVFFQSNLTIVNMFTELPILLIVNIFMTVYFLETEIKKFRYKSILLLVLASVSVLSAFLRLIPLPLGWTLAFLIPITAAIVFGPVFGFLVGQISMLTSGIFMGALGPWLPYQAFLVGFLSYVGGVLFHRYRCLWLITCYATLISFFYGYWISIPYWSVALTNIEMPTVYQKIKSYNQFYLISSLLWDITRASGNLAVFCFFYKPVEELLVRAKKRLVYYQA